MDKSITESINHKRVYLAGPDVFLPNAKEVGLAKIAICAEFGFEGCFPLDNAIDFTQFSNKKDIGYAISVGNEKMMRSCDAVIANMTPFRGPSTDPGTAYEMGFMRALNKIVLGYSNTSIKEFKTRTESILGLDGNNRDKNNNMLEDFGLTDNLMLDSAVYHSTNKHNTVISSNVPVTSLENFRECVVQLAKHYS
jgi:nucleoside 2-deoxyribosyltransferase